jgi:hypothetical protein
MEDLHPSPPTLSHSDQALELRNPFADLVVLVAHICEELPDDLVPHVDGLQFGGREGGSTEEFVRSLTERLAFVGSTDGKGFVASGREEVRRNERERKGKGGLPDFTEVTILKP